MVRYGIPPREKLFPSPSLQSLACLEIEFLVSTVLVFKEKEWERENSTEVHRRRRRWIEWDGGEG